MTEQYKELTPEQEAIIPEWNEKWKKVILSTSDGNMNKELCTQAAKGMYKAAKLQEPQVLFVHSPLVAAVSGASAAVCLFMNAPKWEEYALQDMPGVNAELLKFLANKASFDTVLLPCLEKIISHFPQQMQMDIVSTVKAIYKLNKDSEEAMSAVVVSEEQRKFISSFMASCAQHATRSMNGGNLWASWCGFISYFRDVLKVELDEFKDYAHYENLALNSGWRYVHEKYCIISDKPQILSTIIRDGVHIPSNEEGPSHAWADGWRLWYINGVIVDEQIVMRPETQTIEQIDGEQNAEIRRIRIERYGWDKYLEAKEAEVIEHRYNPIEGCDESLMKTNDMTVLVCACPSTGRVYAMEVSPDCDSCQGAQDYLSNGKAKNLIGAS